LYPASCGRRLLSAAPKIEIGAIVRRAHINISSLLRQRVKATRGRVRIPKAGAKRSKPFRAISHEVLWSAMRLRIAFII